MIDSHRMSDTPNETSPKPAKRATTKRAKKGAPEEPVQAVSAEETAQNAPELAKKRSKRRRGKKSKGAGEFSAKPVQADFLDGPAASVAQVDEGIEPHVEAEKSKAVPAMPKHQTPSRMLRHDGDALAKKAWKIYLAEVSEEGVVLIGDQDARELSKRCFRLAEIFMDEQARHT